MITILDASAVLAYLKDEPGNDVVKAVLAESAISSVNWAEVVQKMLALGANVDNMLEEFQELGMTVEPFTVEDGEMAGRLWTQTRMYGLSLGDRACLSLGMRLGARVLTGDRAWQALDLSIDVQLMR